MSTIDPTKPVAGTPTTQSVRDNFSAAKTDIETAQSAANAAQDTADAAQPALGFTAENAANKSTNVTTDGASDTKYPSAKAVKTYADTKQAALGFTAEDASNKSTNVTTDGASDAKYPSAKAVKTYADGVGFATKGTPLSANYHTYEQHTTAAHGLSATPTFLVAWAECTSADGNFSVGDIIPLTGQAGVVANSNDFGIFADSANIGFNIRSNGINFQKKTTDATFLMAPDKWTWHIVPYILT